MWIVSNQLNEETRVVDKTSKTSEFKKNLKFSCKPLVKLPKMLGLVKIINLLSNKNKKYWLKWKGNKFRD